MGGVERSSDGGGPAGGGEAAEAAGIPEPAVFDGVVLAGGAARRLGGADKPRLVVAGARLLDVAVAALAGAGSVVVVGDPTPADVGLAVRWVREEPVGGGPTAALAAGLAAVTAGLVVVLAADLPFVRPSHVAQLLAAVGDGDGALAVDPTGRDQLLLAAYRTAPLRAALPADPDGARLRDAVRPLALNRVMLAGEPPPWWDCDSPEDLDQARSWWEEPR